MIKYASYSDIGGRDVNQDTVMIREENNALCAVLADGLGGYGGGQKASGAAARAICGGWRPGASPGELVKLTKQAHSLILDMQSKDCYMKTTVVVLSCSDKNNISYAYSGDSRLYHFANGDLKWQSLDHSASQIAVLLGSIEQKDIRFHEDRSRILRALGLEGSTDADSGTLTAEKGLNAFLLCSDGFWEYIYEDEMAEQLRSSVSPDDWLAKMRALRTGRAPANCDNNSAAAVWINNE